MVHYRIVLVEPVFEESIGFVARAMKNFGLSSLHLVNPVATLGDDGRMRAGHAQELLDSLTFDNSLPEALRGVDLSVGTTAQPGPSPANLLRKPMSLRELASVARGNDGMVALVFGREGTGLNNIELGQCDALVTIPTDNAYPTLNLSHAAAIVFYELYVSADAVCRDQLASEEVKTTILRYVSDTGARLGVEDYKIGLTIRAFRNVLGRSGIRRREASLLAGMLRRVWEEVTVRSRVGDERDGCLALA